MFYAHGMWLLPLTDELQVLGDRHSTSCCTSLFQDAHPFDSCQLA
jgi:hypothetical protein